MIAHDDQLTSSLARLRGVPADARLERRVIKFQAALRRMHQDPSEVARIEAIAADAERHQSAATDDGDDATTEVLAGGYADAQAKVIPLAARSMDAVILRFNEADSANEELYERARHAADAARHAQAEARRTREAWRTAQLEHPERRGWLPLMSITALALLGLDSWAGYFAAEALGGDQLTTLMWAALFLVILGLLEVSLAWFAERSRTGFRILALGLGVFAVLLGLLRFGFLAATGAGIIATAVGACLFTVCTIMFVAGGFAALRYTETVTIWQARRHARKAAGKAAKADAEAAKWAAERDRRVDAYVTRIRPTLLHDFANAKEMEDEVRAHILREAAC